MDGRCSHCLETSVAPTDLSQGCSYHDAHSRDCSGTLSGWLGGRPRFELCCILLQERFPLRTDVVTGSIACRLKSLYIIFCVFGSCWIERCFCAFLVQYLVSGLARACGLLPARPAALLLPASVDALAHFSPLFSFWFGTLVQVSFDVGKPISVLSSSHSLSARNWGSLVMRASLFSVLLSGDHFPFGSELRTLLLARMSFV